MLTYLSALDRTIRSSTHAPLFTAARLRHPALAAHETLASAMSVLAGRSRDRNGDKDAITRALVAEYQESRKSVWLAAILVAYAPMVRRLRRDCRNDDIPPGELDQLMFTTLIDSIDTCPLDHRWLCLELRRCTRRHVFNYLDTEKATRRLVFSVVPEQLECNESTEAMLFASVSVESLHGSAAAFGRSPEERAKYTAYLRNRAGHVLTAEEIALITTTFISRELLTHYVARNHPELDDIARRRIYEKIKKRRSRAMTKLRNALAGRWQSVRSARAAEDDHGWMPVTMCPL